MILRPESPDPGLLLIVSLTSETFPKVWETPENNGDVPLFSFTRPCSKFWQSIKGMVKKWHNFNSEVTTFSPWHPSMPWMHWNSINIGKWSVLCRFLHGSLCHLLCWLWWSVCHVHMYGLLAMLVLLAAKCNWKWTEDDTNVTALLLYILNNIVRQLHTALI